MLVKLTKAERWRIAAAGLVVIYSASRLYNLLALPIFTDEAIYIRWSQVFRSDIHQFFISLTDGKQPLFIWTGSVSLRLIHSDPLLAMRLVSVLAGLLTMVGLYVLANELFGSRRLALLASSMYVIYPFSLVYDRLGLYESMLSMFTVWALYVEVALVRRRQISMALLGVLVISGGLLTKSSAFFFLYLLPFSLLLMDMKAKSHTRNLMKWFGLAALVVVGSVACYSLLRFSPNFHFIADKNDTFIYPFHEWLRHPWHDVLGNTRRLIHDFVGYSTFMFSLLVALALVLRRSVWRQKLVLLLWFVVPFMALAFFGKPFFLTPRYLLFMAMPLLILAALAIDELWEKLRPTYLAVAVVLLAIAPMLFKDFTILTNFSKAAIPQKDHKQLIAGYASGVGVKRTADFLRAQSRHQPIFVATEGLFGLMPQGLQDYLEHDTNVTIVGLWPITETPPPELLSMAKRLPTYVVFYAPCPVCSQTGVAPAGWPVKPVFQIAKLQKDTFYSLYQVRP